jgi:hypothetical protein
MGQGISMVHACEIPRSMASEMKSDKKVMLRKESPDMNPLILQFDSQEKGTKYDRFATEPP